MKPLFWDGRAVHATRTDPAKDRRTVEIALTIDAAGKLALSLNRLRQTTFALPDEMEEMLDAVNYVILGDEDSIAAHARMEAGKGMTPDGGYRSPNPPHDGRGLESLRGH